MKKSLFNLNTSIITKALFTAMLIMVLMPYASFSQVFFREYAPNSYGATNIGQCIIRPAAGNDEYLHVGEYTDPNTITSGHAIWTNIAGTTNAATNYDRLADEENINYSLKFIEDNMVTGSYNPVPLYNPTYTGHPAVGTRVDPAGVYVNGFFTLQRYAWVTIIDPVTRNRLWDHVIDVGIGYESRGISLVRDAQSTNDFYVLTQDNQLVDAAVTKFSVTKYSWVGGNVGHVMSWSVEYTRENYDLTPVGIVQQSITPYNLVVVGNSRQFNSGTAKSRIFSIEVNRTAGAPSNFSTYERPVATPFPPYTAPWAGDFVANSVTGPFTNGVFHVAGRLRAASNALDQPIILSLRNNLTVTKKMKSYDFYTPAAPPLPLLHHLAEFKCVKEFYHDFGNGSEASVGAVGLIGGYYSSDVDALTFIGYDMHDVANTATPPAGTGDSRFNYGIGQGAYFRSASSMVTVANWLTIGPESDPDNDKLVYTGYQDPGASAQHVIGGAVAQQNGRSDCDKIIDVTSDTITVDKVERTIDYTDLAEDFSEPTTNYDEEIEDQHCEGTYSDYDIEYGKIGGDPRQPMAGLGKSTDKASFTVLEDAINITYSTSQDASIKLVLVDVLGTILADMNVQCTSGTHYYTISTNDLLTGSYYVALSSPTSRFNKNIVIIK